MYRKTAEQLLSFIEESPTCFHAVAVTASALKENGFKELKEENKWNITKGGKYFVIRNASSIIAFTIPDKDFSGYHIIASHSDSPSFKIKENPEIEVDKKYIKLNVEGYGGMICSSWFDRPLSVAGRIIVKEGQQFVTKLVNVNRDLLMLPNLAIHLNHNVNDGYKYNAQIDMLPIYGDITAKDTFMSTIAATADVQQNDILGHDLFLYNRVKGTVWGANEEFISAPRLDDLQCAFASLQGFLRGSKTDYIAVHCVFDNEEVGSNTKQGAASTFLYDSLVRINECLGLSYEEYLRNLSRSFLISADNAHAVHPNHVDKADPVNRTYMNDGIVIKYNACQKYCTDAVSAAMFKDLCREAGVPFQIYTNRSDAKGGSTLGNISNTKVSLNSVDVGLPQLAMHSPYETAGVKDTLYMIQVAEKFFS